MSRFGGLLQNLCADGVPFVELGDLVSYQQPTKFLVSSTEYSDSYRTPVLTAGQTFILGYTNEETGIYPASESNPVIIFDDFTTAMKWVDFPFKAKSSAMKILTAKDSRRAGIRYLYFALQTIRYEPQDHARQWIGTYSKIRIPVPPLEVQREIVRILDQFTQLEAELEAELEARRAQYDHYRSLLLNSHYASEKQKEIKDVLDLRAGRFIAASRISGVQDEENRIPCFGGGGLRGFVNEANQNGDHVLIGRQGALCGNVKRALGEFYATEHAVVVSPLEELDMSWVYHKLASMELNQYASKSAQPGLAVGTLNKLEIRIPPLSDQKEIGRVLDSMDSLVNDLERGLPAELKARRQQYAYYRDRLLSFKEVEVEA